MCDVIIPRGRFRSLKTCNRQESRGINIFDDSIIHYPIGDRCKAKSSSSERFFGSFSSLNCEAHQEFQNQYKMDE